MASKGPKNKLDDELQRLKTELSKIKIDDASDTSGRYLAFDIETTGLPKEMPKSDGHPYLGEYPYLVEVGFVPFDAKRGIIYESLALKVQIKCPDIETLKKEGRISEWNLNRPDSVALIKSASDNGVGLAKAEEVILVYFDLVKEIVGKKPVLAGKSIASLDKPILWNYFSPHFIDKNCRHQDYDVTGLLQFLRDIGTVDSLSMEKLAKQFLKVDHINHDSISDALVVARLVIFLTQTFNGKIKIPEND